MNFKKFIAAAVLILGAGAAFAQNTDEKTIEYTQKAITQSLTIYQAHKDLNQLTEQDKLIDKALNITLPGIFNQVENPTDGLDAELENTITTLASTLLTYQQLYPANMLDQDYANMATISIALNYAAQQKLISEEVAQILFTGLMESMMTDEE